MLRDIARDMKSKKSVSVQTVNFIQNAKNRWTIMLPRKHAQPASKHSTFCSSCEQEFSSYYYLQQHLRK